MDHPAKKFFSSKVSIVGLFATLTIILTIPLAVLLSQQEQSAQSRAAEPTVFPPVNQLNPSAIPSGKQGPVPYGTGQGFGYIAGYVYVDQNQNGQREQGEAPFSKATIIVTQLTDNQNSGQTQAGRSSTQIQTDENGYFKYQFSNVLPDSLNYIVRLVLPGGYKTIDTNPIVFSGLHNDAKKLVEFGIFPLLTLSITPTPICLGPNCPSPTPPNGCFYQKRICTLACPTTNPNCCGPILVCPSVTPKLTCIPRPSCLDAVPRCAIAEPAAGWCPITTPGTTTLPTPTVHPL